jgi:hypothetical protein
VHQSLEVRNTSSRDLMRPRLVASAMASPTGFSDGLKAAVSKCRYPNSIAVKTADLVLAGSKGCSAVPIPTRGSDIARLELSFIVGICGGGVILPGSRPHAVTGVGRCNPGAADGIGGSISVYRR